MTMDPMGKEPNESGHGRDEAGASATGGCKPGMGKCLTSNYVLVRAIILRGPSALLAPPDECNPSRRHVGTKVHPVASPRERSNGQQCVAHVYCGYDSGVQGCDFIKKIIACKWEGNHATLLEMYSELSASDALCCLTDDGAQPWAQTICDDVRIARAIPGADDSSYTSRDDTQKAKKKTGGAENRADAHPSISVSVPPVLELRFVVFPVRER